MKTFCTVLLVVLSFQTTSAQWWSSSNKVKGNGDYTTETRRVSEYDQISLQGSMDVKLIAGKEGQLSVQAESNFMEHLVTEVRGGELKISVEQGVDLDPSRNMGIIITVPFESLDKVSLTGSGDITSSDRIEAREFGVQVTGSGDISLSVNAGQVQGQITGSGDIELSGEAQEFECKVTGSGDFDASRLKAQRVTASVSGSGDIDVFASQELKTRITGSGDISYSGNPKKQDFKTSGSGTVSSR